MFSHNETPTVLPHPRSRFSTISSESRSNLVVQDENVTEAGFPSYSTTISKYPDSPRIKTRLAGIFQGWKVILLGSWLNIFLVMLPISWTVSFVMEKAYGLMFVLSLLALIPLVKLHDLATHELALRIGGAKTGLLNASLSNVVAIVVAISALRRCELRIVQSSLIGSILGKLLLVLGLCFFAGGISFSEQGFDATATQIHSSLLSISVGALLLPAVYHFSLSGSIDTIEEEQKRGILSMSHGVSIILLFIYVAYLIFQLWSHTHLYQDRHNKKSPSFSLKSPKKLPESRQTWNDTHPYQPPFDLPSPIAESHEEATAPQPQISWTLTILVLILVTTAASLTADKLVQSMDGIHNTVRKEWVALILLPAVTSLAECMTAVNVSMKDQLTLSISVAVGSALQTALFVIPFMVTLAWIIGKPLSLLTDPFESLVLYISVQTMSYVVADGKSNWLEGMILVCLYIVIAVAFWYYPGSSLATSLFIQACPGAN